MNAPWRHIVWLLMLLPLLGAAQPQVTWLETTHDFGTFLEEGGKVQCPLRMVNTGDEPLVVTRAQASCGCTAADFPTSAIAPGDTAAITVIYNPSGRPGQFEKQVMVYSNGTPRRSVLTITGNVIATPQTLNQQYPLKAGSLHISATSIPYGELPRSQSKTQFLSTYNASIDTLLVHVGDTPSHLVAAMVPDTVPPGRVAALTVHYRPDKAPLWGLNVDTVTLVCEPLHAGGSARGGIAQIDVMAQVMDDFAQLTPQQRRDAPVIVLDCDDRLDCGIMQRGQTVTRTLTVTNGGKSPLELRRLWVPDGEGVTVAADRTLVKRRKSATVTVTIDTSRVQGDTLNTTLTLITNDPQHPVTAVRLVGLVD